MILYRYLYAVIGLSFEQVGKMHYSSRQRALALALAIHIPVALWAVTSYTISNLLFQLNEVTSIFLALFAATLIYIVERIVIASPSSGWMTTTRFAIGLIIAILGASSVDLLIFSREIELQLMQDEKRKLGATHTIAEKKKEVEVDAKYVRWQEAQKLANCELTGTCGSGLSGLGVRFKELQRQAEEANKEYITLRAELLELKRSNSSALEQIGRSDVVMHAGLLSRLQALHTFTRENGMALIGWLLLLSLLVFFELLVIISKLAFGVTTDDRIEEARERHAWRNAEAYVKYIGSPTSAVRLLISDPY